MAKDHPPENGEIVVTQERLKSAYQNFLERKSGPRLAALIDRNFSDMRGGLKLPKGYSNLIEVVDAIESEKDKKLRQNVVAQIVEGNPKNFLTKHEEKRIYNQAKGELILLRGVKKAGESLGSALLGNAGSALAKGLPALADLMHGYRLKANIGAPAGTAIMLASWALPVSMAQAALPSDIKMSDATSTMARVVVSDICTTDFMKSASYADQAYAITFGNSPHQGTKYAYNAIMAAAGHGVPLIALHNISYLESARHTDMQAGNSSASSLFQIIDSQKLPYIKMYGQETFAYKEAKERISTGNASMRQLNDDRALVQAFDFVKVTPRAELERMRVSRNASGPVFEALQLINKGTIAAEIVALDMKAHVPEIMQPNLSPERILEISAAFYREHHLLGIPNHNLFGKLAHVASTTPISISAQFLGESGQRTLVNVADQNKGLLNASMTAPQALESIIDNFVRVVREPQRQFETVFKSGQSGVEFCLTEKFVPMPVPRPDNIGEKTQNTAVTHSENVKAVTLPTPRPEWLNNRSSKPTY